MKAAAGKQDEIRVTQNLRTQDEKPAAGNLIDNGLDLVNKNTL